MSFKDINYFQNFVNSEVIAYRTNPKSFCEGKIRSIFSRAYYTIFLHCRDELGLEYNEEEASVHKAVKENIKNTEINKIFHEHNKTRRKMDYNNINIDLTATGRIFSDLNCIKRDMNRILGLKKDDLIKKS